MKSGIVIIAAVSYRIIGCKGACAAVMIGGGYVTPSVVAVGYKLSSCVGINGNNVTLQILLKEVGLPRTACRGGDILRTDYSPRLVINIYTNIVRRIFGYKNTAVIQVCSGFTLNRLT